MTTRDLAYARLQTFNAKWGAEIERLYASGHAMSTIASKLACSPSKIERVLKFRKVRMRRPGNWIGRRMVEAGGGDG